MWPYIAVLIVSVVISAAMAPKVKGAKPGTAEAPTSEEGKKIKKIYGTVWIDDPMVQGFKQIGTEKIKD